MVGFDTQIIESLLNRDADSAAAAPEPDEKIGLKPRCADTGRELEGIPEEIVGANESFFHCFSEPAVG